MTICGMCDKGKLRWIEKDELFFGVNLGAFRFQYCPVCKETWANEKTMKDIEKAAKAKGVWGLGAQGKITMAGNSLAVRIPKKIAEFLHFKQGKEVYLHPRDKHSLVIELKQR